MKKQVIYISIFVLVFFLLFGFIDTLFSKKYFPETGERLGFYKNSQQGYYELKKDSLDFVFIGSSHTANGIIPQVVWEENGASTYVFSAAGIMPWTISYYTKEALKTQKPKAVFIDIYTMVFDGSQVHFIESSDNSSYFTRFSLDKLQDIYTQQSMMKLYSPQNAKTILDYSSIAQTHDRWKSLNKNDFTFLTEGPRNEGLNGYMPVFSRMESPIVIRDFPEAGVEEVPDTPLSISWEYLKKAIQTCHDKEVEPVLLILPYEKTRIDDGVFQKICAYAEASDIKVLDLFDYMDDLDLDLQDDFYNATHLNHWGAEKVSTFLAKYTSAEFDISKTDGNETTDYWEKNAVLFDRHEYNNGVSTTMETSKYMEKAFEGGYTFVVGTPLSGAEWIEEHDALIPLFGESVPEANMVYIIKDQKIIYEASMTSAKSFFLFQGTEYRFEERKLSIDDYYRYTFDGGALNICLFDPILDYPIDRVFIYGGNPDEVNR